MCEATARLRLAPRAAVLRADTHACWHAFWKTRGLQPSSGSDSAVARLASPPPVLARLLARSCTLCARLGLPLEWRSEDRRAGLAGATMVGIGACTPPSLLWHGCPSVWTVGAVTPHRLDKAESQYKFCPKAPDGVSPKRTPASGCAPGESGPLGLPHRARGCSCATSSVLESMRGDHASLCWRGRL